MNPTSPNLVAEAATTEARELSSRARAGTHGDPIDAILKVFRRGKRFLICAHTRPDGDSVGSMLALAMLLRQMGKLVDLVTADPVLAPYRQLPGADFIREVQRVRGAYDAAILLECDSLERTKLRGLETFFLVNIDHHITGSAFADLNWIDREAASLGEMVYRLARAASATVTPEMATCLYTTVLMDTGGFSYGSVRESTFTLARDLVRAGADPIAIARNVFFSMPASRLLLLGAALRRLTLEGHLAWLWVTNQDMERSNAAEDDCEGIVNSALSVAGVEAAVFLRDLPDGHVRLSLRSKGKVNVAAIAKKLGGGGHENAAGCTIDGPLQSALKVILAELRAALPEQNGKLRHSH